MNQFDEKKNGTRSIKKPLMRYLKMVAKKMRPIPSNITLLATTSISLRKQPLTALKQALK